MRVALKFAYDGKKFYGYARQPKLKTVEGELINTLINHGIIQDIIESYFRSASRTDKGVSALGSVVAFNTDISKTNILQTLSNDSSPILIYGFKDVESEFNPRYAKFRQYRYYLPVVNLDIEKIISALNFFTGKHDFSNFAKLEPHRDPIRTIYNIIFTQENDILIIDFFAQTFLWHQIRRIISALIKVGSGKLDKEEISKALNNPDKKVDFGLASAGPLILKDVVYNFEFEYDKKQLIKLKQIEKKIIFYL
jgi:tRNA pseudouridine38-40 synthase